MELNEDMKNLLQAYPELADLEDSEVYEYREKQKLLREQSWQDFIIKQEQNRRTNLEEKEIKTLANILDLLNFPQYEAGEEYLRANTRKRFYKFLKELDLCEIKHKNPSEKAIEMGYAQIKKEMPSWYGWKMEFLKQHEIFYECFDDKSHNKYYSKSKLSQIIGSDEKVYEILRPYCLDGDLTPTQQSIDSGIVKIQYIYEWHIGCVEKIVDYFIDIYKIMEENKIKFNEAKLKGKWLGIKGSFPGDESPMTLLGEVDPETFELINQLDNSNNM